MKEKATLLLGVIMIVCFLSTAPGWSYMGEVKTWFYTAAPSKDYYGGVDYKNGYIYENCSKTDVIYKREMDDGEIILPHITHQSISSHDCGMAWDGDNDCWWIAAPWDDAIYKIPAAGGNISYSFGGGIYQYGLDYDEGEDLLLIGSNVKDYVLAYRYNQGTGSMDYVKTIDIDMAQGGIVKVGDKLWASQADHGHVYEFDYDSGDATGNGFTIPDGREAWALTFDGKYLWVRSNWKDSSLKLFQVDILFMSPTPTVTPTATPTPSPTTTPPTTPTPLSKDILDYDGDGTTDIAVFRPDQGFWAIQNITRAFFGMTGDTAAPGDFNGDGTTEIAIFRPDIGFWATGAGERFYFGSPGDLPVPSDYDGDGCCDGAVFRDSSALWAVRNVTRFYFGQSGDVPVYTDFGADGTAEAAIFRPASGFWAIRGITRAFYGRDGDHPVPGRYRGLADLEIAIFRPTTGLWAIRGLTKKWFAPEWVPYLHQAGDWNGDGYTNIGGYWNVYSSTWQIIGVGTIHYGEIGDLPVSARLYSSAPPTPTPSVAPTAPPLPTP